MARSAGCTAFFNLRPRRVLLAPVAASLAILALLLTLHAPLRAQVTAEAELETPTEAPASNELDAAEGPNLVDSQQGLAEKYAHLEDVLMRMAEVCEQTDPRRAALLRKVLGESKERLVSIRFETLAGLLKQEQFALALENQETLDADLLVLLELLESENRADTLDAEKERIAAYLKELGAILRNQKSLQGRTEGAVEPERLAGEQGELGEKTGDLAGEIQANEGQSSGKKPPASGDGEPSDSGGQTPGEPSDDESPHEEPSGGDDDASDSQGEASEADGPAGGSEQSPAESSPGSGSPSESSPAEGSPSSGQPSGPSPGGSSGPSPSGETPPAEHPASERLRAAQRAMQRAEEKLQEAESEGAVEEQEKAIRELEEARAELEEILRQLREEEILQTLEMLEIRMARMLGMQKQVLEGTQDIDAVAADGRLTRAQEIEAGDLSVQETKIVEEADRALTLLREEGSSVAFLLSLEQTREDMADVTRRLAGADVGEMTQAIEEDIIAALQEMLDALEKAMEEAEERRNQPPSSSPPQDPPLIDMLAELKLIRSLQVRVNDRTQRYAKLILGEQADRPELLEALGELSNREADIYEILRELEDKQP